MNCKPGDLAYLSNDLEDAGHIVEVLYLVPNEMPMWRCKSKTPIRCTWEKKGTEEYLTEFSVEDRYLRPISGPKSSNENEERIKEPAC